MTTSPAIRRLQLELHAEDFEHVPAAAPEVEPWRGLVGLHRILCSWLPDVLDCMDWHSDARSLRDMPRTATGAARAVVLATAVLQKPEADGSPEALWIAYLADLAGRVAAGEVGRIEGRAYGTGSMVDTEDLLRVSRIVARANWNKDALVAIRAHHQDKLAEVIADLTQIMEAPHIPEL